MLLKVTGIDACVIDAVHDHPAFYAASDGLLFV